MEKTSANAPARVDVTEFAEAAFSGVLRAIDARRLPDRPFPRGPIIWGIILMPEDLPVQVVTPGAAGEAAGRPK